MEAGLNLLKFLREVTYKIIVKLLLIFFKKFTEDPCSGITCGHPLMECIVSEEGKPVCECPFIDCAVDNDLVCATDGQTYLNTCLMDLQSCRAGKIVSVEYKGECNKSLETAGKNMYF